MYKQFEDLIHSKGSLLIYLPPYSPHLNPIEFAFSQVKKFIQRHCNLVFYKLPVECINLALLTIKGTVNAYAHCGYGELSLDHQAFE
jgi:transposase